VGEECELVVLDEDELEDELLLLVWFEPDPDPPWLDDGWGDPEP
jgi:hypothetical protein